MLHLELTAAPTIHLIPAFTPPSARIAQRDGDPAGDAIVDEDDEDLTDEDEDDDEDEVEEQATDTDSAGAGTETAQPRRRGSRGTGEVA